MPFAELVDLDVIAARTRGPARSTARVADVAASLDRVAASARVRRDSLDPPQAPQMSAAMYARRIDDLVQTETLHATARLCGAIQPEEIENLIRRAADIKARYVAALLDAGQSRGMPQIDQFKELEILRSWTSELSEGLALVKNAVAKGEIKIQGIKADSL